MHINFFCIITYIFYIKNYKVYIYIYIYFFFSLQRTRLASIGGENQRCCVMSMLRFLLTNKLATHFNWAGRKKIAFKGKRLMSVIYGIYIIIINFLNKSFLSN